jgi:hypothetical protein
MPWSIQANVIEYTVALGDTDGDGRVTLRDFSYFQTCFGSPTGASGDAPYGSPTGVCRALDLDVDGQVSGDDFRVMFPLIRGPGE